jgi:hypothetical protein
MSHIPKTDNVLLSLHRAGWSIGETSFLSNEGVTWLVFGTNGEHSIHATGKTYEEAWRQAYCKAEEKGLVQPRQGQIQPHPAK